MEVLNVVFQRKHICCSQWDIGYEEQHNRLVLWLAARRRVEQREPAAFPPPRAWAAVAPLPAPHPSGRRGLQAQRTHFHLSFCNCSGIEEPHAWSCTKSPPWARHSHFRPVQCNQLPWTHRSVLPWIHHMIHAGIHHDVDSPWIWFLPLKFSAIGSDNKTIPISSQLIFRRIGLQQARMNKEGRVLWILPFQRTSQVRRTTKINIFNDFRNRALPLCSRYKKFAFSLHFLCCMMTMSLAVLSTDHACKECPWK